MVPVLVHHKHVILHFPFTFHTSRFPIHFLPITASLTAEAEFYEIEFPRPFFETRPHAAQTIRGCVLSECDVGLLRFLGPLGA